MKEMIEHKGVVEEVVGQSVRVRIVQVSACNGCHAKGSCMAAEAKEKYIDCQCTEPLQVGDEVVVEVAQSVAWQAVLLAFIVPFLLLMFMLWLLSRYFTEPVSGTVAIFSVMLYYAVLALFRGKMKKRFRFIARK